MDAVTTLSDKLLSLVHANVPALPNRLDRADAVALVIGGALIVSAWIIVIKLAAAISETTSPQS